MDTHLFKYGDTVRMIDDIVKVHQKQQIGAGWNDDMALVSKMSLTCCYDQEWMNTKHIHVRIPYFLDPTGTITLTAWVGKCYSKEDTIILIQFSHPSIIHLLCSTPLFVSPSLCTVSLHSIKRSLHVSCLCSTRQRAALATSCQPREDTIILTRG